jgi:hypothetical protein
MIRLLFAVALSLAVLGGGAILSPTANVTLGL